MPSPPPKPVLASTLLAQEEQTTRHHQWRWRTGIPSIDASLPPNLWTSGKVIGIIDISQHSTSSASNDIEPLNTSSRENASSERRKSRTALVTQLLVTHLASLYCVDFTATNTTTTTTESPRQPSPAAAGSNAHPAISIITPPCPANSPLSPSSLASAFQEFQPPLHLSLLSSVSLLQYLDFPGLADALAEVLRSVCTVTATAVAPSILVIDGLLSTLQGLLRRSGLARTNALLGSLLRELISVSRAGEEVVVLVALGGEVLESISKAGRGVQSAFSSKAVSRGEMGEVGAKVGSGVGTTMSSVMNLLVSGIDTLILLHTVEDDDGSVEDVVEVLFDRVGDGTGRWGVR